MVGPEERARALLRLEALGIPAIEAAIARLAEPGDPIVFDRSPWHTRLVPEPATAGPTPLKAELRGLLYRILDGGPPPPQDPLQPGPPALYVGSWKEWVRTHRGQDLATLRAWAAEAAASAQRSYAAEIAPGRAARPAFNTTGAAYSVPDLRDPALEVFAIMREATRDALKEGRKDCAGIRALADTDPRLARHADHACWRLKVAR